MQKVENMHDWISELPDTVAAEVLQHCSRRTLLDRESLFHPGDRADACYRLMSGRLIVCNFNSAGQELLHAHLMPGDCIGEWSLIAEQPRMNHTYANGDSEVLVLHKDRFDELYMRYPDMVRALNKVMARRLRLTFMMVEDAALLPLCQRLARTIVRLAHSVGKEEIDGRTVIEAMSQDELSRMVGSTRQSVGRELKKLKEDGDVEISYGKLIIRDIAALSEKYDKLIAVEPVVAGYGNRDE
jgi:CRP-like cAMP-binding protein